MSRASDRAKQFHTFLVDAHKAKNTEDAAFALATIKKEKLYKEQGHRSFSAWCEAYSPFSVKYSYRLSSRKVPGAPIDESDFTYSEHPAAAAAEQDAMDGEGADAVAEADHPDLVPVGLAPVDPDLAPDLTLVSNDHPAAQAAQSVRDEKPVSHAGIDEAIRGASGDMANSQEIAPLTPPPPPDPVKDQMGNVIPDHLSEGYTNAHVLFEKTYDHLYGIRDTLKKLLLEGSAVGLVTSQRVENIFNSLAGVEKIIDKCRPFTLCLYCSGSTRQCRACGDSRFLTEVQYLDSTRKERS